MDDTSIGQVALDAIIEGGLVHADEEEPALLIWSANAQEQIGAAILRALDQEDG